MKNSTSISRLVVLAMTVSCISVATWRPVDASSLPAIHAGGGAVGNFVADTGYSGTTHTTQTSTPIVTTGVANAAPEAVYQTGRSGKDFTYTLTGLTPSAPYALHLHFAEYFWHQSGKRIFDIIINGTTVTTNLDIYARARDYHALVLPFAVRANASGQIVVSFLARLDNAKVDGIEVLASGSSPGTNVTTYHNDNLRTGWNATETALTPSSVSASLAPRVSVALDEQVDAQPLFVSGLTIRSAKHDVVYVTTENDTVYALDAVSGSTLWSKHLGTPIPQRNLPGQCDNNGPTIGITATPVVDIATKTLYLLADTSEATGAVFRLHALDLTTGADKLAPRVVSASHALTNGTAYTFNANVSRSRPALLEANGAIYAGFSSYCDYSSDITRGWVLGWSAATLAPLSGNAIYDRQASSPNHDFLSSVWMAGYGIAADAGGNLFFVTGNSDRSGSTYDGVTDLQESVVKQSGDLSHVLDLFTPYDWSSLDRGDTDFGSGGVLLLPDQPGAVPHLATAAGKNGNMYLLDRDHLGGYKAGGPNAVLGTYGIGGCWCGESYYTGSDGVNRVVSSGGNTVAAWAVRTGSGSPTLALAYRTAALSTGQDGGFFTSVSSAGATPGTAVVWALSRPTNTNPANVLLYAFDGVTGRTLYTGVAGTWPSPNADANLVPLVANGRVYVASDKRLTIFGLQ